MTELAELYQCNYSEWAQCNVELLRTGRFNELDIEHLLVELSDKGKRERAELENRLIVLIAHLLKWEYQCAALSKRWREFNGQSWRSTIVEQRERIQRRLRKSPGLKAILNETVSEVYNDARQLASKDTRLPPATFPITCPYSIAQLLDDAFCPQQ